MRPTITALALAFALAACGEPAEEADDAVAPEPVAATGGGAQAAADDLAMTMPRSIQGKWRESVGARVTALECDGMEQANIGKVMTVRDEGYSFFETGGRITSVAERAENMIRAIFDTTYADERTEASFVFEAQDSGQTLIVQQVGEGVNAEPVRYLRCPEE